MGPLNRWPAGHLIMALSSGPSVEFMTYRLCTQAGSPHRTLPSASRYAGQSRNVTPMSTMAPQREEGPASACAPPPACCPVEPARLQAG